MKLFFIIAFSLVFALLFTRFWYHRKIFGSIWIKNISMSPEGWEKVKREGFLRVLFSILFLTFMIIVFWNIFADKIQGWLDALKFALMASIGFILPPIAHMVLWEDKNWKVALINFFHWIFILCLIALVILFIG